MSKIDLQKYFDDALTFTFQGKDFKVDESNKAYQLCQKEITEATTKGILGDGEIQDIIFKGAFGESQKELKELNLPARAYSDMAMEIMSAWSGVSKETIEAQMKIPSKS